VSEPNESVMTLINKLLNLASHENTPEHEAKAAEERAERLMAQHMIEEHELRQAAERSGKKANVPVVHDWSVNFEEHKTEAVADQWEFDHQVLDMMMYVLEHCNVRVNTNYKYRDGQRVYQIVGYRDDITYAERIWFNVFKTFVTNVNPRWDLNKSVEFNAYTFASAGVSWKDQVLLAEKAKDDRLEWPWRYQDTDPNGDFYTRYGWTVGDPIIRDNTPWGKSIHKLKRACKKYCDSNGLDYPYAGGSKLRIATRNSFARSYRATIRQRLDDIRKLAQEGEEHVDAGKFALALVDTRERVDAEFYNVFPEFDPEVRKRKMEERERQAQARFDALSPAEKAKIARDNAREERNYQKRRATTRTRYRAIREDPTTRMDGAAWARGQKAAQTVNLRADEEVKKQNKKEIN
jgi:Protein of unknown function (DUF2786)